MPKIQRLRVINGLTHDHNFTHLMFTLRVGRPSHCKSLLQNWFSFVFILAISKLQYARIQAFQTSPMWASNIICSVIEWNFPLPEIASPTNWTAILENCTGICFFLQLHISLIIPFLHLLNGHQSHVH